ncbi:hypothetical protein OAB00_01855 [Akkermansiaceae bacterium]|nr:hypothetical protein [Akkermansiaceae bacterium]
MDSVESFTVSGASAIITLKSDATLDEAALGKAFSEAGVKLEGVKVKEVNKPVVAYEMVTKGIG